MINSLKEFYEEKEEKKIDEEYLNEDPATVIMAVLGLPSAIAVVAWGASIIATAYIRGMHKLISKTIELWKNMFMDLKGFITKDFVRENLDNISSDPLATQEKRKAEKDRRAFSEELKEVYDSIDNKEFIKAKEEFSNTPKYIQNNPDVHKVIISEITKSIGEPPMYISSPGNETYQAIKKVINIRVAKAAAYATKMTIEKNVRKSSPEELDME